MFGVTLDTNVYVSAFVHGGKPLHLLELAAKNAHQPGGVRTLVGLGAVAWIIKKRRK